MIELFVFDVVLGATIALGASGLSLIFGTLRFANFAHGELMTWGAYIVLLLVGTPLDWLGLPTEGFGPFSIGWRVLLATPVAVVAIIALLGDRLVFAPLRKKRSSGAILAMASLGLSFILRMVPSIIWGNEQRLFHTGEIRVVFELGLGAKLRADQLIILTVAGLLATALHLFMRHARMGKAMRAVADDAEMARVAGIDTDKVIRATWIIGGSLAAVGGILFAIDVQLNPNLGWNFLIPLFAATILGTIGNLYGALLGGMVIGIVQQMSTAILVPSYKPVVAFGVLVLVLVIRPRGLFGGKAAA